jgi:hypothetical protein
MSGINDILRRASFVDTSGAEPPRAMQMVPMLGGGVYAATDEETYGDPMVGRLSLGILGAFIVGAVAFYVWTNGIQGGG